MMIHSTLVLNDAQVTQTPSGRFVTEASGQALPVGRFPKRVMFQDREYSYYQTDLSDNGEDVMGVWYRHGGGIPFNGTELLIIND